MKRFAIALLLASGCTTLAPIQPGFTLQKDTGTQCVKYCGELDMRMSAVVIISTSTGCVCEPRENKAGPSSAGAAVASGTVAVLMSAQGQDQREQLGLNPPPAP